MIVEELVAAIDELSVLELNDLVKAVEEAGEIAVPCTCNPLQQG